jgi:hypothetical protein
MSHWTLPEPPSKAAYLIKCALCTNTLTQDSDPKGWLFISEWGRGYCPACAEAVRAHVAELEGNRGRD